jgi:trigger factor
MGEQVDVDEDIKEGDRVIMEARELDGNSVKEDGWQTEVTVLVDMIADDKVKKALLNSKKGDKVTFEASKLEKDTSDHYVRKHILKIDDDEMEVGDNFEGEIKSVMRVVPAEVNEDLFKAFGEEIKSEEDARAKLVKDLEAFFNRQSEALLYREVQDRLLEMNDFDMPRGFLKRWLLANDEKLAERESLDEDVDNFIKSMRWTLIKRKLQKEGDIHITHGEVLDHFVQQIRNYMGGYGVDEAFLVQTARQLMDNQEQVSQASERILDDKVFDYISDKIDKDEKLVSRDELNEIIQKVNQS